MKAWHNPELFIRLLAEARGAKLLARNPSLSRHSGTDSVDFSSPPEADIAPAIRLTEPLDCVQQMSLNGRTPRFD
jgi:hypothetical protein